MSDFPKSPAFQDLEVKDAQIIFNSVWAKLERETGRKNLRFPKEIIWLNGAPGSGKGTQTKFIMEFRDLTDGPIVVSDLLTSPKAQKLKDTGTMVGDAEVLGLVLRELLNPIYESGVVIDGFPRTKVQVECLKLIYKELNNLRAEFYTSPFRHHFPQPIFHIMVLFVDETESVKRQLLRGERAKIHNQEVINSGEGSLVEVRATDSDNATSQRRYQSFKVGTYEALKNLQQIFHYHYINAHGSIDEVRERIMQELRYQSSLELGENTYDRLRRIPLAEEIIRHARQDLVHRLDDYDENCPELFERVVRHINEKFMPIIIRHAITGKAIVNSEDEVFHDPRALQILIDVYSERGYHVTINVRRKRIPEKVNLQTGEITNAIKRIFSFQIRYLGSEIRRGLD